MASFKPGDRVRLSHDAAYHLHSVMDNVTGYRGSVVPLCKALWRVVPNTFGWGRIWVQVDCEETVRAGAGEPFPVNPTHVLPESAGPCTCLTYEKRFPR